MTANDKSLAGLHHVTAITADAQKNIDFYCGVLGLRLVKLTVNFDDPGSYHLYYGDELGRPGTIMTFFAWAGAHRGPNRTAASERHRICRSGECDRVLDKAIEGTFHRTKSG